MAITGSYNYPGLYNVSQGPGTGQKAVGGRGPLDVVLVGSNVSITASLSASDGTTDVELTALSGTTYQNTSSFTGDAYSIIFASQDVQLWSNLSVTLVNNHSTNSLESASIEFSPNNTQWEVWDNTTFAGLGTNEVKSMQIAGNSRKYLRIRAIPSGSGGALTGSIDTYLVTNNG